jgi:hypothetical protein
MRPQCTRNARPRLTPRFNKFVQGLAREVWPHLQEPVEPQTLLLLAHVAITQGAFHCDMGLHLGPNEASKGGWRSQLLQGISIVRHQQRIDYRCDVTQFVTATKLRKRIARDLSGVTSRKGPLRTLRVDAAVLH